jgi:hypothetical protein
MSNLLHRFDYAKGETTRQIQERVATRSTYAAPAWPVCIFVLLAEHAAVDFALAEFQVDARNGVAEVVEFAFLSGLATNSTGDLAKGSKHLHFLSKVKGQKRRFICPAGRLLVLDFWSEDSPERRI